MKSIIRAFLFSYLSLVFTISHFDGFILKDSNRSIILISLGLGLIYIFVKPFVSLMSLSNGFVSSFIVHFFINLMTFFIFDKFLPFFALNSGRLVRLNLFGFMLESYSLSIFWSFVVVSLVYTIMSQFLNWLVSVRK